MKSTGLYKESDLLLLVSKGNEVAFRKIFDQYSNKLYNYVLRLTGKEELSEEIMMDTFLKVWVNREALTEIVRFDAYLYTLVRNQAFNALKRLALEGQLVRSLSAHQSYFNEDTEETVVYNDYHRLLNQAVSKLPPRQKLVYTLSRDKGLKYDEIALKLNLSKNTVKSHLKKAMSTLRTVFTHYMAVMITIHFTI